MDWSAVEVLGGIVLGFVLRRFVEERRWRKTLDVFYLCQAQSPKGARCTLPLDHDGREHSWE
jgi:hypothetical protein